MRFPDSARLLLLVQSVLHHQPAAGLFSMGDSMSRPSTMPTPQDALPGKTWIINICFISDLGVSRYHLLILRNRYCFFRYFKKKGWRFTRCIFETTYGSGIAFYVSYIHSTTMYIVQIESAWKDYSNHTKYSK